MHFLSYELAQGIVERTMKILKKNINVMNEEGVIIGSGEKERINQVHDGALLVLKKGESVEIDERSAAELKGAKPGINLPIRFHNQIIGVVGITGEPEQIRNFAELVKMAAELVLEQSFLLERVQWKQRLQSEIVNLLISEEPLNEAWLEERASFLGYDLKIPRTVIVLKLHEDLGTMNQKLINDIHFELGKQDLTGVTFNNEIVILKAGEPTEQIAALKRIAGLSKRKAAVAIGNTSENISGLKSSYRHAQQLTVLGPKIHRDADYYSYETYWLDIKLSMLAQKEEHTFSFYDRLLAQDKKGELAHTLDVFIKEGGDLGKIADHLFIHRNTLRYRLDKITELTGKDPRNVKMLFELYVAKLVNDLN
ncbi:sugar diacid recognition domain-containing protein [Cytobacillus pseudoceanisediminis]|uniref:Sugar diacid recognition domain-containing protein n=1 Tax=Cytobacillus pseudoceanisediminis TaxID=3051614 RepID=A0ABZ2ZPZ0_9BACI|nr:sugar diacid recognition domain-containing protein [Cytobacillus oceanisediminis]MCM3244179.1 helix-turn-helix domain-containing protein [Cytobacillus oceanisediminis]